MHYYCDFLAERLCINSKWRELKQVDKRVSRELSVYNEKDMSINKGLQLEIFPEIFFPETTS